METQHILKWYNLDMKKCRSCFRVLALTEFYKDASYSDGHQASCKHCRAKRRAQRNKISPIGFDQLSIEHHRQAALLSLLFKSFDGTKEVEIPIKAIGNPHTVKRGCVIRPLPDKNRILINSVKGLREYEFELVSPQFLIQLLKELHLEVSIPNE